MFKLIVQIRLDADIVPWSKGETVCIFKTKTKNWFSNVRLIIGKAKLKQVFWMMQQFGRFFWISFRRVPFPQDLSPDGCQSECICFVWFPCLCPIFDRMVSSQMWSESKLEQTWTWLPLTLDQALLRKWKPRRTDCKFWCYRVASFFIIVFGSRHCLEKSFVFVSNFFCYGVSFWL